MAFGFVKSTQGSISSTSLTITIPAVKVGYLLVINIKFAANVTGISITDNASTPNTYATAIGPISSGANFLYQFYGVAVTGGATTVTISWTTSTGARATVEQFSGGMRTNATVFDKAASNTGSAATSCSVSLSPTNTKELISASLIPVSGVSAITAGTNYLPGTNNTSLYTMYRQVGSNTESAPISWTTNSNWIEVAAAYIPAPSRGNFMEFV